MWTSYPTLQPGQNFDATRDGFPTEARVVLRMDQPYKDFLVDNSNNTFPMYKFSTNGISTSTNVMSVGKSALDNIKVVPNPYYGWSEYENSQLDKIVKITNLPVKCVISIYTSNGTLVRQITKDNTNTWVEWDLNNRFNVPIASGIYIIHIDAGDLGEKVVKWLGAMLPVDLNAF